MIRLFLLSLTLFAFTLPALAQEDPTKDPRNLAKHFNPAATLCDDTLQWLMIQRLASTLRDDKLAGVGKIQLAYEKSQDEFEKKHGKEVDEIVQAFGNTVRMSAKQREPLMRRLIAISDAFPDVAGFQKQILAVLSIDEAAPLIKLLRDRRQMRLMFMDLSPGILEETTLPREAQAKILAAVEPATKKAYPYRSTAENIQQWVREQSQLPDFELSKTDIAQLDRLMSWTNHRRIRVMNEALLALRVDLPKEDFAKFEAYLRENGQWRVRQLEQVVQPPPEPVKPDVPQGQRDPLKDSQPVALSAIAIPPRDINFWLDSHGTRSTLPRATQEKLKVLRKEYEAAKEAFEENHSEAYVKAVTDLDYAGADEEEEEAKIVATLLTFNDKLPAAANYQRAVLAALTAEEAAPLMKSLREQRQRRMALFEFGAGITKDLDVPGEAKAVIEKELKDAATFNKDARKAFEKLEDWRMKQSPKAVKTIEALREDSPIARQLNWLMIDMIETIDNAMITLEDELSEADYAKLEAKAMELGAKLVEPLDAKGKKE